MPQTRRATAPNSEIRFTLNGQPVTVTTDPARPLLLVLREDLALTGVKQSCDMEGECGACTVIVDGEAQRACLLLAGEMAGRAVITVEGLGTAEQPHPLQTAFLEVGAVQCGYCTPGMLLSAKALLDRNPDPSRDEIVKALAGNLCRCTGYVKIIEAVSLAAARMRGAAVDRAPGDEGTVIGGDLTRHKGWERVSGATRYAEDIRWPEMTHLHLVRSPHAHARVTRLDTAAALAVPGVLQVLTAADVPGENSLGDYSVDEPLLAPVGGKVRMIGDPIAAVIGTTPEAAAAGAEAIQVEYEILPHTFEIKGALAPGAIQIHEAGNLLTSAEVHTGDIAAALAGSDVKIEATYQTSFQAHMAMEREAAIGYIDEAGRVAVICGSHEPHWNQGYLATILGLPPEQIRVITPPMGGSFGGKQDPWPMAMAAVAARCMAAHHLRKPVRLAYTRQEVMEATPKRHPYTIDCTVAATADGELTGMQIDIQANTGAYDSAGHHIAGYALAASVGPYRWRAVEGRSRVLYSNGPKAGQFRGFGTPQPVFALECTLDELIEQLGADPLEFRLRNALGPDDVTGLGFRNQETLGFREVLETIRPDYDEIVARVADFNADPRVRGRRRGVGLAGMLYRFGKYGVARSRAEAELELDGRITIYASGVDFGQGVETVFTQLAAENLGVPRAALRLVNADTAHTLDGDVVGASRIVYWVGGAVADAARHLRAAILEAAAEMLDRSPDALALTPTGDAVAAVAAPDVRVSLAQVATEMKQNGHPRRLLGQMDLTDVFPPDVSQEYLPLFVSAAHVAEVEVDMETGHAKARLIVAAHDVGKAVNPRDAVGQIQGGVVMGLGSALIEEFVPAQSRGYSSYALPTITATPEIRVHLVEVPGRYGPLGAKGMAEATIHPTPPAIINAVSRAIGARIRKTPATSERILAALRAAGRAAT